MALCDFCFQDKQPLQPVHPGTRAKVCKACGYTINKAVGFLKHSGVSLVVQEDMFAKDPPTPQTSRKPKRKATKSKSSPEKGDTHPPAPE